MVAAPDAVTATEVKGIDREHIWPDYFARLGQPDAATWQYQGYVTDTARVWRAYYTLMAEHPEVAFQGMRHFYRSLASILALARVPATPRVPRRYASFAGCPIRTPGAPSVRVLCGRVGQRTPSSPTPSPRVRLPCTQAQTSKQAQPPPNDHRPI